MSIKFGSQRHETKALIGDLKMGDTFEYEGELFIVTSGGSGAGLTECLVIISNDGDAGSISYLFSNQVVCKVDIKI